MDIPLLPDIVKIFVLSIAVLLLCHRIKLPAVVGFLFTGVLSGPHGLGIIKAETDVQALANLGIVLLLFSVGMDFSFKKILEYKRYFLLGGTLQVSLTVLAGYLIGTFLGKSFGESVFFGFLLSLSSTAIVLRILDEKMESDSPHGHLILGMMIFQDIIAIPMMLMIPILSGADEKFDASMLLHVVKGVAVLAFVLFSAVKLVPKLLYQIAKTRNRELFLLTVMTICFAVAWLTESIGMSLSLGAFLAGLIISDSEYKTEAIGDILPFQDIFTSFFFVSIGMLLDVHFVSQQPIFILSITLGILLVKALMAGGAGIALGMPLRTAAITGFAMSQIGEFSFVLAKGGMDLGLGDDGQHQLFLAVALLTMAFTPIVMNFSPFAASWLLRLPFPVRIKSGIKQQSNKSPERRKDHVIITGFGLSGRNLAQSARSGHIPYVILEMNAYTVKKEKQKGEPIFFGDASHANVLHYANIAEAKVIAIVINDSKAAGHIVEQARKLNPKIYIIVRTRYMHEMKQMYEIGADEVIPDEFGSSVEVFIRVLRKYQIPDEELGKIVSGVRMEGYDMLRMLYKEPASLADLQITLSDVFIETHRVKEGAHAINKTLSEIELRKKFGVTAMLIKRKSETITHIDGDTRLIVNDAIVLVGPQDNLKLASTLFKDSKLSGAVA